MIVTNGAVSCMLKKCRRFANSISPDHEILDYRKKMSEPTTKRAGSNVSGKNHPRYVFLDAIRGIAAIMVVVHHTPEVWKVMPTRSYLAVDVFFLLSGFVIAASYDNRLSSGSISILQFIKIRLVRLYPIYWLSVLICSGVLFYKIFKGITYVNVGPEEMWRAIFLSFLFIPNRLGNGLGLFPLNAGFWTLSFELLANLLYALTRPLLTTPLLTIFVSIVFLLLATGTISHGNMDTGANWGLQSISTGILRAVFGFFFGLLIYRMRDCFLSRLGNLVKPWTAMCLIAAALLIPGSDSGWLGDLVVVGCLFPILVLWASQNHESRFDRLLLILGSTSYPIYLFHQPVYTVFKTIFKGAASHYAPMSGIVLLILLIFLSVQIEKIYDIPVRKKLTSIFLGRRTPVPSTPPIN